MNEHIEEPGIELEAELDERPAEMEDEIYVLDASGQPVYVDILDDTEDVEEPDYAQYD